MIRSILSISLLCFFFATNSFSQHLKPGFDKQEFIEMLKIGAYTTASPDYYKDFEAPKNFEMVYQSPTIGLDNLWQLWLSKDSVAVISLRGTTTTAVSFLANFYAAMVPAKGELDIDESFHFKYHLADDPKAAVHVGFLISAAYLSRDIVPKIDSCYKNLGIKEFIIAGHSQGGAITYLLTSHLESLKHDGIIPSDVRFKTCASASPKPGNLYYAYAFENLTRNGWSYNVVNSTDWVPEVPFSIQTVDDFNNTNPFINVKSIIKKQKFPASAAMRHVYKKLSRPALKAQKNYEKYLGNMVSKSVKQNLSGFIAPDYYSSNNYVRTGYTIVLFADDQYFEKYPENVNEMWQNHFQGPYLFLTEKLP